MKDHFYSLVDHATKSLQGGELFFATLVGETSDFVRFNHGKVRQATSVTQAHVELTLVHEGKRQSITISLSSRPDLDAARVDESLADLRKELQSQTADPYLVLPTEIRSSELEKKGRMPSRDEAVSDVVAAAEGLDLVGLLASGRICRGFASSTGQRNWHALDNFNFDWSTVHSADKAVKSFWAGSDWDRQELARRIDIARRRLGYLDKPSKKLTPGSYRTYLAPSAVDSLVRMLNWGGFSERSQRTKQSALQRLVDGEVQLSEAFTLAEHTAEGMVPLFDELGFARPGSVAMIQRGKHAGSLVSSRSAKEYGVTANGANEEEDMQSMVMDAGALPTNEVLRALDTGIYISNLWYLSVSDRNSCRITGLTRFETFWVEKGEIIAPVDVMRFDDSIYRIFGESLESLTSEREFSVNPGTYSHRSIDTSLLPGALLRDFRLTL